MSKPLSVVRRFTYTSLIAYKQPSTAVVTHKPVRLSQGVYKRASWCLCLCRLHGSPAAETFVGEFISCCQAVSNWQQAPKGTAGKQVCHVSTTATVICNQINWLRVLSQVKGLTPATRHSQRLQKADAESIGLVSVPDDSNLCQGEKSGRQAELKLAKAASSKCTCWLHLKCPTMKSWKQPMVHDQQLHLCLSGQAVHVVFVNATYCVPTTQHMYDCS